MTMFHEKEVNISNVGSVDLDDKLKALVVECRNLPRIKFVLGHFSKLEIYNSEELVGYVQMGIPNKARTSQYRFDLDPIGVSETTFVKELSKAFTFVKTKAVRPTAKQRVSHITNFVSRSYAGVLIDLRNELFKLQTKLRNQFREAPGVVKSREFITSGDNSDLNANKHALGALFHSILKSDSAVNFLKETQAELVSNFNYYYEETIGFETHYYNTNFGTGVILHTTSTGEVRGFDLTKGENGVFASIHHLPEYLQTAMTMLNIAETNRPMPNVGAKLDGGIYYIEEATVVRTDA